VDGGATNNVTDGSTTGNSGNVTTTLDGKTNNTTFSSSSSCVNQTGNPGNVTTTKEDSNNYLHEPASYAYKRTSDRYCNTYPPVNSLGLEWTVNGTCQAYIDCPELYYDVKAEEEDYLEGDFVVILSDYLNDQVIGSISCPNAKLSSTSSTAAHTNGNEVLVPYAYEVETSLGNLPGIERQGWKNRFCWVWRLA